MRQRPLAGTAHRGLQLQVQECACDPKGKATHLLEAKQRVLGEGAVHVARDHLVYVLLPHAAAQGQGANTSGW